jgi:hypothetical protein
MVGFDAFAEDAFGSKSLGLIQVLTHASVVINPDDNQMVQIPGFQALQRGVRSDHFDQPLGQTAAGLTTQG